MKGKRIRYQQTGEFHSLTFSCFRCRGYFSTDGTRDLFEDALERVRQRYLFVVGGYVVMPEHLHLLVNEPKSALLSKAIQALTMRSRERPFWQAHYHDFNVSTHTKFVEKLRYIHRNPRGPGARTLCAGVEASSSRARGEAGRLEVVQLWALSNWHTRDRRD